jgi:hypothetical protein
MSKVGNKANMLQEGKYRCIFGREDNKHFGGNVCSGPKCRPPEIISKFGV